MFHSKLTGKLNIGVAFAKSRDNAVSDRSVERADANYFIRGLESTAEQMTDNPKVCQGLRSRASAMRLATSGACNPGESRGFVRSTGANNLPKSTTKKHRRPSKRTKADKAALENAQAKRDRRAAR